MSAFGIACTVMWTELYSAMKTDGMNPPEKCGPATRAWIAKSVREYFDASAGTASPLARVDRHQHLGPIILIGDETLVGKKVRILAAGDEEVDRG